MGGGKMNISVGVTGILLRCPGRCCFLVVSRRGLQVFCHFHTKRRGLLQFNVALFRVLHASSMKNPEVLHRPVQ
ncbi:hypothetical protein J6590_030329 [Homalodisca vitripennis]|nr:hypothetical protein J6590_030329 [Homalodisca vitripennis]